MATKKNADSTVETEEWRHPAGAPPLLPAPFDDDDAESPLDRVMTMLQGSASDRAIVKLYRKDPINPKGTWCADYSVSEFENGGNNLIRREWGPGTYYVWLYGPHPESGRTGRLAYEAISIAQGMLPASNPVTASPSSGLESALAQLLEMQRATLEALTNKKDTANSMDGFLDTLIKFKTAGLMGAPAPTTTPISETLAIVRELRGAASELSPDMSNKSDMQQMLEVAGPVIAMIREALAAKQMESQVPQLTIPQSVRPVSETTPEVQKPGDVVVDPVELNEEQQKMFVELKKALNDFLDMAKAGKSTEEGADYLAEKLPDDLFAFLDQPNWFELLANFEPAVKDHETWLRECVAKLDDDVGGPTPAPVV